ncbi:MAG: cytochrome c biogenesis CcdA family protein [Acidimicrobiia bacterium]
MQARQDRGPGAVYVLGAFSGVASACCAPVLAGVVALSGAASSFVAALLVGVAYVFGMVVPLFVIALLWDRYDWGNSAWLRGRDVTVRIGRRAATVHSSALAGGLIMIIMGLLVALLALTGPAMATSGWQARLTADLQHYASVILDWFDAVPGWASGLFVFVILGWVVRRAVTQHLDELPAEESSPPHAAKTTAVVRPVGAARLPAAPEQGERS